MYGDRSSTYLEIMHFVCLYIQEFSDFLANLKERESKMGDVLHIKLHEATEESDFRNFFHGNSLTLHGFVWQWMRKCQNYSFRINLFRNWYLLRRLCKLWLLPFRKDEWDDILSEIKQDADIGMEKTLSTLWIYRIRVRTKLSMDISWIWGLA